MFLPVVLSSPVHPTFVQTLLNRLTTKSIKSKGKVKHEPESIHVQIGTMYSITVSSALLEFVFLPDLLYLRGTDYVMVNN